VILVGLTGGMGSGKSTVSSMLAARGAVIVDADAIVREVQEPGSPVLEQLAARFGADVLDAGGALDRAKLASVVFGDPEAVQALNAIVHPAVRREMDARVDAHRRTDRLVVLDIPLLVENPRPGLGAVIVVDVPVEVQVARLVGSRGVDEADARARIARQATREQRLAAATFVLDNSRDVESLERQVEALWPQLLALPPAADTAGAASPST